MLSRHLWPSIRTLEMLFLALVAFANCVGGAPDRENLAVFGSSTSLVLLKVKSYC